MRENERLERSRHGPPGQRDLHEQGKSVILVAELERAQNDISPGEQPNTLARTLDAYTPLVNLLCANRCGSFLRITPADIR